MLFLHLRPALFKTAFPVLSGGDLENSEKGRGVERDTCQMYWYYSRSSSKRQPKMGGLSGRLRESQESLPKEVRTNLHWKRIQCMQFLTDEVSKQTSIVDTANTQKDKNRHHGRLREMVVYDRFQLWWIWLRETLVAYLRWSLKKSGRTRRLDCIYFTQNS